MQPKRQQGTNPTRKRKTKQQTDSSTFRDALLRPIDVGHKLMQLHPVLGNRGVGRILETKLDGIQRNPADGQIDVQPPQQSDQTTEKEVQPQQREAPAQQLIAEDDAQQLQPGQMRRSEFLDQLHNSVCGAAEQALAGTIWSAMGCPYIDRWFSYYRGQSSQHIERALLKYAPEANGVGSARDYIRIVTQRLRHGIQQWTETGEMAGVPEELAQGGGPEDTAAAMSGFASGAAQALSGFSAMLFKEREGGSREGEDLGAIQAQLRSGHPLAADVKTRMESAFGTSFSGVRVHTNTRAQELSAGLHARAFTIGNDVAFAPGEYQPGSLVGDALIAHELAHVAQQSGRRSEGPVPKSGIDRNSLEEDADLAAVGAMFAVWGEAAGKLSDVSSNAMPRLRSGLKLQRCESKKTEGKAAAKEEPKLLTDFAAKFSDAANLIRKSEEAMKLIREAQAAGVKFGGYVEEGPGKDTGRANTVGDAVYVPKSRTDKVLAMSDFLFELNNAIRAPKFAKLDTEAAKGAGGALTDKQYAYKNVELEVEGMLRLGEVWFETKKTIGPGAEWNKYDNDFFLSEYEAYRDGKKTKDDIVKQVLSRVYETGTIAGKTVEQYYIDIYKELSGGK